MVDETARVTKLVRKLQARSDRRIGEVRAQLRPAEDEIAEAKAPAAIGQGAALMHGFDAALHEQCRLQCLWILRLDLSEDLRDAGCQPGMPHRLLTAQRTPGCEARTMRGDRIIRHLQPGDPADAAMGRLAARFQVRQGQHPAGETPCDDQHMHVIMRLVGMPERKPWQLPGRQAEFDQGCRDEALPVGRGKAVSVGRRERQMDIGLLVRRSGEGRDLVQGCGRAAPRDGATDQLRLRGGWSDLILLDQIGQHHSRRCVELKIGAHVRRLRSAASGRWRATGARPRRSAAQTAGPTPRQRAGPVH